MIKNDTSDLFYIPTHGLMIALADEPKRVPTTPVEKLYGNREYAPLGTSNNYWKEIYDRTKNNSYVHPTMNWQSNHLSSCDLQYGTIRGYDKKRNEIFEPLVVPEIDEFLEANDQDLYKEEAIRDLKWWSHAFPEFRLNAAGSRITTLSVYDALHCRFSVQNKTTGNKDYVFVSANWPSERGNTWKKIRCLDPYYNVDGQMRNTNTREFIYPISFSSPGNIFYQDTAWHRIVDSSWLDVAEKIPAFKKYLMDNQMTIKYVIHVPISWWSWRYPNWKNLTDVEKETNRKNTLTEFNNALTGITGAGKTLMLTFNDQTTGKTFTKWEVQEMKGTIVDGAYIEDSQEASDHILFSMAQPGNLMGKSPGKGMGAGSGSDIRVSNNVYFINSKAFIKKVCKPYQIITTFNGWKGPNKEKIVWRAVNYMIDTTDKGSEVSNSQENADSN